MLIVDAETRSRCDLSNKGAYNYARDPSTNVLCWAFTDSNPNDEWLYTWVPGEGPLPPDVCQRIAEADYIAAQNAAFDRLIWEYVAVPDYDFPEIPFDKWYCTAAQCRVNNLPASLEDAARALDAAHKKDPRGAQLIRLLSIPQKDGTFNNDPELLAEMYAYCRQDARTTKAIVNATRVMTKTEHEDWLFNEDINERGVLIDVELADAAQRYANDEFAELALDLKEASHGAITKHTQTVRAAKWVLEQCGDGHPIANLMRKYVKGEMKITLDKEARGAILDAVDAGTLGVPPDVFDVIDALNQGSASSVAKFKNMRDRADDATNRVQGAFVYAGASQTLRYASRGLQLHNFPSRGLFEHAAQVAEVRADMMRGADIAAPVMQTLKKMLRGAIIAPPDHDLVIGDWSGIEARVLPWLADTKQSRQKLDKIASGVDVYTEAAEAIGSDNRSVGKVLELALGYAGGVPAFNVFAKSYKVTMTESEIRVAIDRWRKLNAWVVKFWRDVERAAFDAIANPGAVMEVGRLRYMYAPTLMKGSLLCLLPDDSVLTYPQVRVEGFGRDREITAMKASVKMKADAREWPRERLYGGRLVGNATQGTAAALLRSLLAVLDNVIAHVHDEVVCEVHTTISALFRDELEEGMCMSPSWAEGLPLAAKPIISKVYTK